MNWRALGCALLAAAVFVGLGVWALLLALGRVGCPATVYWGDQPYAAVGEPTSTPDVGGEDPVRIGVTFVGALTRDLYGPEGTSSSADPEDLPEQIALACGDESFQSYVPAEPDSRLSTASAYRSVIPDT
jgi:hypothetical protein